jgi:hypothetical protein
MEIDWGLPQPKRWSGFDKTSRQSSRLRRTAVASVSVHRPRSSGISAKRQMAY